MKVFCAKRLVFKTAIILSILFGVPVCFNGRGFIVSATDISFNSAKDSAARQNAGDDIIEIKKINTCLPIVTAATDDVNKLHSLLDSGAVLYPESAQFGQVGQTILLGHSAPANWPNIKYDKAFSRINELEPGDAIKVSYRGATYSYSVSGTHIIDRGGQLPGDVMDGNSLLLVSCWPPGHNWKRIVVESIIKQ